MKFRFLILVIFYFMISHCSYPEPRDVIPPGVIILYPTEGAVVSTNSNIIVNAADNDDIVKVWCYVDGILIGETSAIPYSIPLNIDSLEKKVSHALQAMAMDKEGNTGSTLTPVNFYVAETPDLVPPLITIVNPQSGQVVENSVQILAHAVDERSIKMTSFFIDGDSVSVDYSYPYQFTWQTQGYSDSTEHTIMAKAYDTGDNSSISPVTRVTVYPRSEISGDITPPEATFLYPLNLMTVTGTVQVSVDMTPDRSGIARAEFYVDGQLTASQNNPPRPWIFNWNSASKADGRQHTLYVRVIDGASNEGTQLITVTVN